MVWITGVFIRHIIQDDGHYAGFLIFGEKIPFEKFNGADNFPELLGGPASGDVHIPFDARQAQNPVHPRDLFNGLSNDTQTLKCFRSKDVVHLCHHQDHFLAAEHLFEVAIIDAFRKVFNGKVVYGCLKAKIRQLGGESQGDQANQGQDQGPDA